MRAGWLEGFEQFLRDPAPGFRCYTPTDYHNLREDKDLERAAYLALIRHIAHPPADARSLTYVRSLGIPGADDAAEFFALHDGVHVFAPAHPEHYPKGWREFGAGVEVFPVAQWEQKTREIREEWDEKLSGHDLAYGRDDFVAIGHPRGSWNYFHWVTRGPSAGRIFWWPWTMPPQDADDCFAESFDQFVTLLYVDPPALLNEVLGGYSRYFDGRSDAQWVPSTYVPDVRRASWSHSVVYSCLMIALFAWAAVAMRASTRRFIWFWLLWGIAYAAIEAATIRNMLRFHRLQAVNRLLPRLLVYSVALAAALAAAGRAAWLLFLDG
jgi:hypothetical protein